MEKTNKKEVIEKILFLCLFIITLLILCKPLIQDRIILADDYLFHYSRIQSLTDSLKAGIFPVKVHFPMANSCGYATGLFYPNLFLYIPAIINIFINNVGLAYKIFLVIILTALYFISYFSIKSVTKNSKTALLSSMLIMLSNGLLLNLYDRTALGELLGFLFMVPLICGLYNYVYDNFDKPYLIGIGFFGVANSHLITTLICIVFSGLYFLVHIKSSIKNPKKVLKLAIVAVIVILLSTSFWLPMLEQLHSQTFKLSDSWTDIGNDTFNFSDLFGNGRFSIGLVITICLPIVIIGLFDKTLDKSKKVFAIFALCIMLLMIFNTFWKVTNKISNIIQFKWRLIGITTILSCISIPLFLEHYCAKFKIPFNIVSGIIIVISAVLIVPRMSDTVANHSTATNDYIETIIYTIPESIGGGQEYLPVETDYTYLLESSFVATTDYGGKVAVAKEDFKATCYLDLSYNAKSIEIPLVYYLGYVANITTPDGTVTALAVEKSENGLTKVIIPDGLYGTINVWYDGTEIQTFSYFISLLALIITVVLFIVCKIKKLKIKKIDTTLKK